MAEDFGIKEWAGYREMVIKAVIAFDDEGNYVIHGSNSESTVEMAKAIQPIWKFDPVKEVIQCIEIQVKLPIIAEIKKPLTCP